MIDISKVAFLLKSLGISQTDAAEKCGLSVKSLNNSLLGRYGLSLPVAIKLDAYLKTVWQQRKGQTIPPEVAQIVFAMLYPPPPFNPFDGDGKSKRKSNKPKTNEGGNVPQGKITPPVETATTAAMAKEDQDERDGKGGGAGGAIGTDRRAAGTRPAAGDAGNDHAHALRASGTDCSTSREHPRITQEPYARSVRNGAVLTRENIWTKEDLLNVHTAAVAYRRLSAQKGQRGINKLLKKFYNEIIAAAPTWMKGATSRNAIFKLLKRVCPTAQLRSRSGDSDLAQRKRELALYALQYAAAIAQTTHAKGAYQDGDWMSKRSTLQGCWDVAEFKSAACKIIGEEISFNYLEKAFREYCGGLSRIEEGSKRYIQETIGEAPAYAGQILHMDGSQFPVEVEQGWGRACADGHIAHQVAFLTDMAGLKTWLYSEGEKSEVYLWEPLLLKFFSETNYAPEKILTDEGGRSFNDIRHQLPKKELSLSPAIRLALAVGVMPYCHTPKNPRAKGTVERGGVRSSKEELKRILVRNFVKAVFRELKDAPKHYRCVKSEAEWQANLIELERSLNARIIRRVGDGKYSREAVWNLPDDAAKRNERALSTDWQDHWHDIVRSGFCMEVAGEKTLHLEKARAEIQTPIGRKIEEGATAILFPGGLRSGDAEKGDELLRGLIIERHSGQPTYLPIEALKVKKSFYGFDVDRPNFNEHPIAKPETEQDRRRRAWVAAGKILPAAIQEAKRKTGTDDVVI